MKEAPSEKVKVAIILAFWQRICKSSYSDALFVDTMLFWPYNSIVNGKKSMG
jgi:hypothetical protein